MTPEEAHHIVNNNIRAPPEKKPEAVDLGTIVVGSDNVASTSENSKDDEPKENNVNEQKVKE